MKKHIIALSSVLCAAQILLACDICGGAINAIGGGLSNTFRYDLIELNFMNQRMASAPREQRFTAMDYFRSVHINGQFFVHSKWRFLSKIGYQQNKRVSSKVKQSTCGITDGQLMLSRVILDRSLGKSKNWSCFTEMGIGAMLPTGIYYSNIHNTKKLPAAFNIGKGSWASIYRFNAVLKRDKWAFLTTLSGSRIFKTSNGYRFGHSYTLNIGVFYSFKYKKIEIAPSLNFVTDNKMGDFYANKKQVLNSSYTASFLKAGLQNKYKNWVVGIAADFPVKTNKTSTEVFKLKTRFTAQVSYILNKSNKKPNKKVK